MEKDKTFLILVITVAYGLHNEQFTIMVEELDDDEGIIKVMVKAEEEVAN